MLGVKAVYALNDFPGFRWRDNMINNVNAPDHRHAVFRLDFASDVSRQLFIACVDIARLQRASKSAGESTTGSGNDVVKRGCVWLDNFRLEAVVFSNRTMHAEADRLWLRLASELSVTALLRGQCGRERHRLHWTSVFPPQRRLVFLP